MANQEQESAVEEQAQEEQMPDAQQEPNGEEAANEEPTEPNGEEQAGQVDWKSLSRKWEQQSKENYRKASKLEDDRKSLEADLEAAKRELAELKASNARSAAVRSAAKAANVDEAVLARMSGDSDEEIAENARILAEATRKGGPSYPAVDDKGSSGGGFGMTLEQINAIKDPTERVMARAKYPNAR